jgi:hypothetical protein
LPADQPWRQTKPSIQGIHQGIHQGAPNQGIRQGAVNDGCPPRRRRFASPCFAANMNEVSTPCNGVPALLE